MLKEQKKQSLEQRMMGSIEQMLIIILQAMIRSLFFKIFIYLAILGLKCSLWDLHFGMKTVAACRI